MTQEQRSKLNRIAGILEGLCWGTDSEHIADGLTVVVGQIDELLEEDRKDEKDSRDVEHSS